LIEIAELKLTAIAKVIALNLPLAHIPCRKKMQ
jgi:hypothetical protein